MARLSVLVCDTMDVSALGLSEAFDVDFTTNIMEDGLVATVED